MIENIEKQQKKNSLHLAFFLKFLKKKRVLRLHFIYYNDR